MDSVFENRMNFIPMQHEITQNNGIFRQLQATMKPSNIFNGTIAYIDRQSLSFRMYISYRSKDKLCITLDQWRDP